jgi:hypothetical protein
VKLSDSSCRDMPGRKRESGWPGTHGCARTLCAVVKKSAEELCGAQGHPALLVTQDWHESLLIDCLDKARVRVQSRTRGTGDRVSRWDVPTPTHRLHHRIAHHFRTSSAVIMAQNAVESSSSNSPCIFLRMLTQDSFDPGL